MRLKDGFEGDYDPDKKSLTISGETTVGNKTEVVLPVSTPNQFFGWVAAVLHEKGESEDSFHGTLLTNKIEYGMTPVPGSDNLTALVIRVHVDKAVISFAMPVRNLSPEQVKEIGDHYLAAMAIIEKSDSGSATH